MQLLDTPQWNALNTSQKAMINNIDGHDLGTGWQVVLSPGARKVAEALEAKGLIVVTWGERDVIMKLRPEGWLT